MRKNQAAKETLQPVVHHIPQRGGTHAVLHQKGHQLVDPKSAGGDSRDGSGVPVIFGDFYAVVFAERPDSTVSTVRE